MGEVFNAPGFQISLVGARVDRPEVKGMFGEPGRGQTPDLIFTFRVKNTDERKILRYQRENMFLGGHFHLHDDVQNLIRGVNYGVGSTPMGALTGDEDILPGEEATHVQLFSVPPAKTKYLILTMDMAAFGGNGKVEFKIPAEKITGLAGRPPVHQQPTGRVPVGPGNTPGPSPDTTHPDQLPPAFANSIGMKMVLIPAGEFLMGLPDSDPEAKFYEKPQHRVRITKPFYLGACEVTVGQFRQFAEDAQYRTEAEQKAESRTWRNAFSEQTDDHPVACVTWNDAVEFCKWLSGKEGKAYRLPTEAQWEYACRAGSSTRYCFGDDAGYLDGYGWYDSNSSGKTHPVGQKNSNAWGLFDMHGNVWEWVYDLNGEYAAASADDPMGPATGHSGRVTRGGCFQAPAEVCRSTNRNNNAPGRVCEGIGFRVAAVP